MATMAQGISAICRSIECTSYAVARWQKMPALHTKYALLLLIANQLCGIGLLAQDTTRANIADTTSISPSKKTTVFSTMSPLLRGDTVAIRADSLPTNPIANTKVAPPDTAAPKLRYDPKRALRWSLLPGAGQIYNEQYWKAPIMASAFTGAFTMTIKRRVDYNRYYDQYATELAATIPTLSEEDISTLRQQKQNALRDYNRWRVATAVVYGVNLLDAYASAHIRNDRKVHSPVKAAYYSAILPGLGQAYNQKYWKVPIIYAGFAATGYLMFVNGSGMQRATNEFLARTRPGYGALDPELSFYSTDRLLKIRGVYKRYYEISIIVASLWYLLNILDATTDAHLHNFDVSDDLSWHIEPYFETTHIGMASAIPLGGGITTHSGLSWVWRF